MKENASTVRKDHAPENRSLLKKIVLNLLRMESTDAVKSSLRLKRKRAAWDDVLRMRFLGLNPLCCSSAEAPPFREISLANEMRLATPAAPARRARQLLTWSPCPTTRA